MISVPLPRLAGPTARPPFLPGEGGVDESLLQLRSGEIGCRSRTQGFFEHGDESARGAIARFESCMRYFCTFSQKTHPLHQSKLLAPFSKGHSDFLLKQSFDRSLTRGTDSAKLGQCPAITRIFGQQVGDPNESWIRQMWKLQCDRLHRFQLMKDNRDQVHLPFH